MKEIILCKYGEIALKGLNKSSFESTLVKNVKRRLRRFGKFDYWRSQSTLYISPLEESIDMDEVLEAVGKIFGIVKVYKALEVEKTMEAILGDTLDYLADALEDAQTFKVEAKRADKKFPHKSPEICAELGHVILEKFPHLSVDVHEPDVTVFVDDGAVFQHFADDVAVKIDHVAVFVNITDNVAVLVISQTLISRTGFADDVAVFVDNGAVGIQPGPKADILPTFRNLCVDLEGFNIFRNLTAGLLVVTDCNGFGIRDGNPCILCFNFLVRSLYRRIVCIDDDVGCGTGIM